MVKPTDSIESNIKLEIDHKDNHQSYQNDKNNH